MLRKKEEFISNPDNSLCISQHDPPFPVIFCGYINTSEKHDADIADEVQCTNMKQNKWKITPN